MRGLTAVLLLGLVACQSNLAFATVAPEVDVQVLDASTADPAPNAVAATTAKSTAATNRPAFDRQVLRAMNPPPR